MYNIMFCKCHQYQITHLSLFKWCVPFINMTLLFYYACFCAQLCVRRSSALLVTRQYAALYDRAHVYRICGPAASTAQVSGVSVVFLGGRFGILPCFSHACDVQARFMSGGGGRKGFLGEFLDNLKQELSKNKEMKENIKKFREEAKKLEESEALKQARRKYVRMSVFMLHMN